jgi:hypothetical protein
MLLKACCCFKWVFDLNHSLNLLFHESEYLYSSQVKMVTTRSSAMPPPSLLLLLVLALVVLLPVATAARRHEKKLAAADEVMHLSKF